MTDVVVKGSVSVTPLIVVVIEVAYAAPVGLFTVMIFPAKPVNVCPFWTEVAFMLNPGMIRLARVEACTWLGLSRPAAWREAIASLPRVKTVDGAVSLAKKFDRASPVEVDVF